LLRDFGSDLAAIAATLCQNGGRTA
jgi:hypothetical protein